MRLQVIIPQVKYTKQIPTGKKTHRGEEICHPVEIDKRNICALPTRSTACIRVQVSVHMHTLGGGTTTSECGAAVTLRLRHAEDALTILHYSDLRKWPEGAEDWDKEGIPSAGVPRNFSYMFLDLGAFIIPRSGHLNLGTLIFPPATAILVSVQQPYLAFWNQIVNRHTTIVLPTLAIRVQLVCSCWCTSQRTWPDAQTLL